MTHREIISKAFQLFAAANCQTYGKTKDELRPMIPIWADMLNDIPGEQLEAACKQCAQTCPDWPSVADIRKAAAEIAEAKRAELRTAGERTYGQDECPWCGGSGWEIDGRDFLDGKFPTAIRCRCRQPGFQLPPPKPRKMLTEAEKSEFAASLGMISGGKL